MPTPPSSDRDEARDSSAGERWKPGTLERESPIDLVRLTRRFLVAVVIGAALFALILWGPWY